MAELIDVLVPIEQEGTTAVVRSWMVSIGETVEEGDPLVELETDKVAMEVPSPDSGILREILLNPDDEANPSDVLCRIDVGAASTSPSIAPTHDTPALKRESPKRQDFAIDETRHSPSVRRILAEEGIDGSEIVGTGRKGRITKGDALTYVEGLHKKLPLDKSNISTPATSGRPTTSVINTPTKRTSGDLIPHNAMRKAIANHMSHSVTTAPHVTAVFEADFSAIINHRNKHKEAFKQAGVKLTFTAYMIAACVEAMKVAPTINSQWHDDAIEVFSDANIGIGTALGDDGLIVPVVHQAQSLSLKGIASKLQDITERARNKALKPADTQNGTFTISNHGVSGSLVATPIIINQPQSAILGVGKLEKRVCVVESNGVDSIQILPKAFVSLTIDHRVIDGHQTNMWLTRFVEVLETWALE